MALLVFFVLVFAGQLIGGFSTQRLPPSENGNIITILSIDGGGIKGILPATVLHHLDTTLKTKDPNADLAHYFDVIGGTSTGGIMAAMLAAPSSHDPNRAAFTPGQIVDFYKQNGPHIFNASTGTLFGPQFDGEFLHYITRKVLKNTRLSQTLTNVVIPSFDIKTQKPVIFSSYKLGNAPYLNALLSDIALSTSAAPIILPPYYFENEGVEFNMIDGAVEAGNPTQVTISEVLQHNSYPKILVLSVGTGVEKVTETYTAQETAHWPGACWVFPLIAFRGRGSAAMDEYHVQSFFNGSQPSSQPSYQYLRIEEHDLNPAFANLVNVTPESMQGLEDTGKQLLHENVLKLNFDTFDLYKLNLKNYEALDRIADILVGERQSRLERKSMEKRGRPLLENLRVFSEKTEASVTLLKNLFI
ncbi:patatin-1-Kuras 2 [Vigna radiata var. radiata]|uniref:Patatin n=1 Tax=Vigna radiata var. radiata TaxID=3916 RepID=A0A1S3VD16_VIGRR|nr:patatin-1-Kuras 2 [Vigna radiata var. radiata]